MAQTKMQKDTADRIETSVLVTLYRRCEPSWGNGGDAHIQTSMIKSYMMQSGDTASSMVRVEYRYRIAAVRRALLRLKRRGLVELSTVQYNEFHWKLTNPLGRTHALKIVRELS